MADPFPVRGFIRLAYDYSPTSSSVMPPSRFAAGST